MKMRKTITPTKESSATNHKTLAMLIAKTCKQAETGDSSAMRTVFEQASILTKCFMGLFRNNYGQQIKTMLFLEEEVPWLKSRSRQSDDYEFSKFAGLMATGLPIKKEERWRQYSDSTDIAHNIIKDIYMFYNNQGIDEGSYKHAIKILSDKKFLTAYRHKLEHMDVKSTLIFLKSELKWHQAINMLPCLTKETFPQWEHALTNRLKDMFATITVKKHLSWSHRKAHIPCSHFTRDVLKSIRNLLTTPLKMKST